MSTKIAIVGLACRLPGASSPAEYWANLLGGVESIRDFGDAELLEAGVPADDLRSPGYVKRAPVLDDIAGFDAPFFGFTPADAGLLDPQQRIFLEVCRDALDDSGLTLTARRLKTGVFATSGGSVSSYLLAMARSLADTRHWSTGAAVHLGNDKDFISTRASYKLDLSGPSVNIQTACSSSIVALHLACRALLDGECEIAIAGASCVRVPQRVGYHAGADAILSKDGRCRPFDAQATGTLFGSGAGAVVLRRHEDAERARDNIYAVLLGTSINNDGGQKVSYTAASVPGQRACIEDCLDKAGVSAERVGYVECHGTATKIGDPLELKSLTQAFRKTTSKTGFCAIGSVKGNIGHLEQAAGIASLIKTVLMLRHGKLVPSIHCETVNPKINIAEGPFYVARRAEEWRAPTGEGPRVAGLSCLGMGGTNAFAVLCEQRALARTLPAQRAAGAGVSFCLSAKTSDALAEYAKRYVRFLDDTVSTKSIADIAYTTNISRSEFGHRVALLAESTEQLRAELARVASGARVDSLAVRPMVHLCQADDLYDTDRLAAAVLEQVPPEVRHEHLAVVARIAAVLARHRSVGDRRGWTLVEDAAAVLRCELLMLRLLQHCGVVVQGHCGSGIGAEIVKCSRDPDGVDAFLATMARVAADWETSAAPPGVERQRAHSYRLFARHFERHAGVAAEDDESRALRSALEQGKSWALRTHAAGDKYPLDITLSEHMGPGRHGFSSWVAALYTAGVNLRWDRYYQGQELGKVSLPTYPYQRKSHWFTNVNQGG